MTEITFDEQKGCSPYVIECFFGTQLAGTDVQLIVEQPFVAPSQGVTRLEIRTMKMTALAFAVLALALAACGGSSTGSETPAADTSAPAADSAAAPAGDTAAPASSGEAAPK